MTSFFISDTSYSQGFLMTHRQCDVFHRNRNDKFNFLHKTLANWAKVSQKAILAMYAFFQSKRNNIFSYGWPDMILSLENLVFDSIIHKNASEFRTPDRRISSENEPKNEISPTLCNPHFSNHIHFVNEHQGFEKILRKFSLKWFKGPENLGESY